jgi:nucleoid DNA-binding protein
MTRDELAKQLADAGLLPLSRADTIIRAIEHRISEALARGESVEFYGFGRFSAVTTLPRTGTNPRSGEPIQIGQKKRVTFKPGSVLKRAVDPTRQAA